MATTFTSTDGVAMAPRRSHDGITVVKTTFRQVQTTTISTNDIIFMTKVPNHSTIIDAYVKADTKSGGGGGGTAGIFSVGIGATQNNIFQSFSASDGVTVITRTTRNTLPLDLSLTDSTENAYSWAYFHAGTGASSTSATASFELVLFYTKTGMCGPA